MSKNFVNKFSKTLCKSIYNTLSLLRSMSKTLSKSTYVLSFGKKYVRIMYKLLLIKLLSIFPKTSICKKLLSVSLLRNLSIYPDVCLKILYKLSNLSSSLSDYLSKSLSDYLSKSLSDNLSKSMSDSLSKSLSDNLFKS